MSDRFGPQAARLAGQASALFGWSPPLFWGATPAELAALCTALAPPAGEGIDRAALNSLLERDRND